MSRSAESAQHQTSRQPAWRRWAGLSGAERIASLEALFVVTAVRAVVAVAPASFTARRIQRFVGNGSTTPAQPDDSTTLEVAATVRDAIVRASLRVPKATCLIQAVSGWYMLRRRGIGAAVRIGVQKSEQTLSAHAWLCVGDRILIGGEDAAMRYTALESHRVTDR